jgi:hypothetical protein
VLFSIFEKTILSVDNLFKSNSNNSDCNIIFFLTDSSVEKILSVCVVSEFENGSDVDINSNSIPSGLNTVICNKGDSEYFAVN